MADLIQIGVDVRTNIKQATADLDKMGGSVVNNINTINRLESEVKQLNRELTRGRVSEAAYAKGMQQINNELGIFQQRAAKAADVERKFGQAAAGGGKSLNRFNMTLQQGGYQLQDFIVQIQSGTSFFTAFSQQGSQFASIFGPKGAVIGAVIAIGSAIAAIAVGSLTAKDALKELQDQVDSIKDSFKNYADAASMAAMSNDEIAEKFGVANDRIRSTLQLLEDLERKVAQQNLSELMSEMADMFSVGGAGYKGAAVGKFFDINAFFSIKAETRKNNRAAISDFQQAQREIAEAQTDIERAEGLSRLLNAAQKLAELSDGINEKEKEFIQNIAQALLVQEQLVNAKTSQQQTTERVAREEYESYQRNIDQRFKGEQAVFDQSVSFSKASQKLIDDNAESRKREINQRFKGEQRVFSQAVTISKATQALIDKNAEARQREINHRFKGEQEVFNQAVEISDELLEVIEDKAEAYAEAVKRKFEDQDFFFRVRFADETELMQQSLTPAKQKGPEKVRKQVLTDIQDTIDALREQTKHETKLLSLTGERLKEEEIYYDLVLKNKDADIKLSDKKLRAIAKEIAAQQEANEMYEEAIQFVDGISDAFSDFVATGLRDFKSFVSSIKDMFVRLLADMAAAAVRNRILIPITTGFMASAGNAAAGTAMGSFGSGTLGASLAGGAAALGSGFMAGVQGFMGGGISGYGATLSATALNAGPLATIGAALPAIAAVVAVIGLFTKKTKLLDSGLRTTVEGFDIAIDTFAKTQSSRLFGLLKGRKKTTYTAAEAELADPLIQAIGDMQQSIVDAAGTLGIGAEAFDNFSYQFKLSLKGLTEEEQLQKINEEILKMGDAFASLTGHFSTMNELLAVAQQRYDLETRKLQVLGDTEALLARQREIELSQVHDLNRELLLEIHALEDLAMAVDETTGAIGDATEAFNLQVRKLKALGDEEALLSLRRERELETVNELNRELLIEVYALENLALAVEKTSDAAQKAQADLEAANSAVEDAASELQRLLDESLDAALSGLERAIDARRDSINQKYDTLISGLETRLDAANEAASRSAEVYSILSGALSGRSVGGITFASRQAARAYVAGGGSDVERLQAAVGVLSEPSKQLFGSFEDYARDFAITSNVLKESKDAAEAQMTADEKTVALLQEQIDQADKDREDQLRLLDEQLEAAQLQIDALKGIDTTVLSVDEAMQNVRDAMATYEQTQANHVELNTSVLSIGDAISALASAVQAQAAAQAAAAAAAQAQAAAAAKAAEAQQQLAVAQSGAVTDVNSTAAKMSLDTAAKISAATPASASEQAMLNRFSGGERPDHIQLAIASGYQYDPSVGGYRKFAAGGMHSGGLRLVGEYGPELEVTGPSRIYSASQTREMMSNPELVAEIKSLRREIADTKAEQRAANVAMVKYNKRTSDQLRTWNSVGLPQERTV